MKPHVVYLGTHGFAVRMIFQTGLLRRLTEAGCLVSVIVPDPADANLREVCARDGVTPVGYPVPRRRRNRWFKSIRKYVVEDIRRSPTLWDKHRESLRGAGLRGRAKRGLAALGLLGNDLVNRLPALRRAYLRAEARLLRSAATRAFLRDLAPDLLVATYPVAAPEPELLLAARELGVRTVLHLLSWDNITSKGYFQALADHYVTWGPTMSEELREYYDVPPEAITACGVPHFDLYFRDHPPAEIAGPYLVFAMSARRYAPGEAAILRQLCAAARPGGPLAGLTVVARPHPSALTGVMRDTVTLDRLRALEKELGLVISYPDMVAGSGLHWSIRDGDMYALVRLLKGAAVVLNSGSTVAVEALALGRPVVLTAFDGPEKLPYEFSAERLKDYTHMRKLIESGGLVVTEDFASLLAALRRLLDEPAAGAEKRKHALFRQIGDQDGHATERVAAALLAQLSMPVPA